MESKTKNTGIINTTVSAYVVSLTTISREQSSNDEYFTIRVTSSSWEDTKKWPPRSVTWVPPATGPEDGSTWSQKKNQDKNTVYLSSKRILSERFQ